MILYLKWLDDNCNTIVCSYKMADYLGYEFMGLPLWPDLYCPDNRAYGVNDYNFCKNGGAL